uniref:Uncharacterized protein n=1 Tax=Hucho hucho TaxID=62062 RepID=A0A4W5LD89_9TELE
MITEDSYPYTTTTQVPYEQEPYYEESLQAPGGGEASLGEEGPTDCNCEPGEPGFAGFAGPKGARGLRGKDGFPGAQGREVSVNCCIITISNS